MPDCRTKPEFPILQIEDAQRISIFRLRRREEAGNTGKFPAGVPHRRPEFP
jgi:hypothetical protein